MSSDKHHSKLSMTKEIAAVIAQEGRYIWIEPQSKSGCHSCDVNQVCGTGLLRFLAKQTHFVQKIENSVNAQVGDSVLLGIPNKGLILASSILYLVPLAMLFFVAIAGTLYQVSEPLVILSSLTGLLVGFWFAKKISQNVERQNLTQIRLIAKLEPNILLQQV